MAKEKQTINIPAVNTSTDDVHVQADKMFKELSPDLYALEQNHTLQEMLPQVAQEMSQRQPTKKAVDLTGTGFNGTEEDAQRLVNSGHTEDLSPDIKAAEAKQKEDDLAINQSSGEKIFNNLAKGVFDAGTAYVNGTLGLAMGVEQTMLNVLDPNKKGSDVIRGLWDNPLTQLTSQADNWIESKLPVYRTSEEQAHPITSMFTSAAGLSDFAGMLIGLAGYGGAARDMAKMFSDMPNLLGGTIAAAISGHAFAGGDALRSANNWEDLQKQQFLDNTDSQIKQLSDAFDNETDQNKKAEIANQIAEIRSTIKPNLDKIHSDSNGVGNIAYGIETGIMSAGSMIGLGKSLVRGFSADQTALKTLGAPTGASSDMYNLLKHDMGTGIPNNKFIGYATKDGALKIPDIESGGWKTVGQDEYSSFQIKAARDPIFAEKAARAAYKGTKYEDKFISCARNRADELNSEVNYLDEIGKKDYVRAGSGAMQDSKTTEMQAKIDDLQAERDRLTSADPDVKAAAEKEITENKNNKLLARTSVYDQSSKTEYDLSHQQEVDEAQKELDELKAEQDEINDKLSRLKTQSKFPTRNSGAIRAENAQKEAEVASDNYNQAYEQAVKEQQEVRAKAQSALDRLGEIKKEGKKILNDQLHEISKKKKDIARQIRQKQTKLKQFGKDLLKPADKENAWTPDYVHQIANTDVQGDVHNAIEDLKRQYQETEKKEIALKQQQAIKAKEKEVREEAQNELDRSNQKLKELEEAKNTKQINSEFWKKHYEDQFDWYQKKLQRKQLLFKHKAKALKKLQSRGTAISGEVNKAQEGFDKISQMNQAIEDLKTITDPKARVDRIDELTDQYDSLKKEMADNAETLTGYKKIARNPDGSIKFKKDAEGKETDSIELEDDNISDADFYTQMHKNLPEKNPFVADMNGAWEQAQFEYSKLGQAQRKVGIDESLKAASQRTKFGKTMAVLRNPISQTIMMPSLTLAQNYAGAVMESDLDLWRSNYKNQKNVEDLDNQFSQWWVSQFGKGGDPNDRDQDGIQDYYSDIIDNEDKKYDAQIDQLNQQKAKEIAGLRSEFHETPTGNDDYQAFIPNNPNYDKAVDDLNNKYEGKIANINRQRKVAKDLINKQQMAAINQYNKYSQNRQSMMDRMNKGNIYFNRQVAGKMGEAVQNPELLKSALTGAIMGFGVTPHIRFGKTAEGESRFYFDTAFKKGKQYQEEMNKDKEVADFINKYTQKPGFQAQIQAMARRAAYDKAMDYAARSGDKFTYESAYDSSMAALVEGFSRAGQLDRLKQMVRLQVGDINDSSFSEDDFKSFRDMTKRNQENKPEDAKGETVYSEYDNATFSEIKDKVLGYKKAILSTIDNYEQARRDIELGTSGKLDAESEAELTWLEVKKRQWKAREERQAEVVRGHIQQLRDAAVKEVNKDNAVLENLQKRQDVLATESQHINGGKRIDIEAVNENKKTLVEENKQINKSIDELENKHKETLGDVKLKDLGDDYFDAANKKLNNPSTSEDDKQALRELMDDYTKESELIKKSEENALKIKDAERAAAIGIESNNKLGAIQREIGDLTANGFNTMKNHRDMMQDAIDHYYNELINMRMTGLCRFLGNPKNVTNLSKEYEKYFPSEQSGDEAGLKDANQALKIFAQYDSAMKQYHAKKEDIMAKFSENGDEIKKAIEMESVPESVKKTAKNIMAHNDYKEFAKLLDEIKDDDERDQVLNHMRTIADLDTVQKLGTYSERKSLMDDVNAAIDSDENVKDENKATVKGYVSELLRANNINDISNKDSEFFKAFDKEHISEDADLKRKAIDEIQSIVRKNTQTEEAIKPNTKVEEELPDIADDAVDAIIPSETEANDAANEYSESEGNDTVLDPEEIKKVAKAKAEAAAMDASGLVESEIENLGLSITDLLDDESVDRIIEGIHDKIDENHKSEDGDTKIDDIIDIAIEKAVRKTIDSKLESIRSMKNSTGANAQETRKKQSQEEESNIIDASGNPNGPYHFMQTSIPEFKLPSEFGGTWEPFELYKDLQDYLDEHSWKPNDYVDHAANTIDGSDVFFMIDSDFESKPNKTRKEPTIFTVVRDSSGVHVIGVLHDSKTSVNRYVGLEALREKIINEWKEQSESKDPDAKKDWEGTMFFSSEKTKAHIYNGKIRHTDDVHDLTPENVGNSRIAIFRDGEDITSGRTANEVNDGAYIETVDSMGQSHYSYVEGKRLSALKDWAPSFEIESADSISFRDTTNLYNQLRKEVYFKPGSFDIGTGSINPDGSYSKYKITYVSQADGKTHVEFVDTADAESVKDTITKALKECGARIQIDARMAKAEESTYLKELAEHGYIQSDMIDDRIVDTRVIMDYYDNGTFKPANYLDRRMEIKSAETKKNTQEKAPINLDGHEYKMDENGDWLDSNGLKLTQEGDKYQLDLLNAIHNNVNHEDMFYDKSTGKILNSKERRFLTSEEQGSEIAEHPEKYPDFLSADDAEKAMLEYSDANSGSSNHVKERANDTDDKKHYTIVVNGKEEKADRMHSVYEKRNDNPEFKGNKYTQAGSVVDDSVRRLFIGEDVSEAKLTESIGGLTYKDENGKDKPLFTATGIKTLAVALASTKRTLTKDGAKIVSSSIVLSHKTNGGYVAGEIDLLVNKNGKLYIYDIKTTSKSTVRTGLAEKESDFYTKKVDGRTTFEDYQLQLSGYKYMCEHDNTGMFKGKKVYISGIELVPLHTTWKNGAFDRVDLEANVKIDYNPDVEDMMNGRDVSMGRPSWSASFEGERSIESTGLDDFQAQINEAIMKSLTMKVGFQQTSSSEKEPGSQFFGGTFRIRTATDDNYQKMDSREFEWMKKALPQVPIASWDRMERYFKNVAVLGPKQWGKFMNGMVILADDAAYGTVYHEAFHSVFETMLSDAERKGIMEEAKNLYADKINDESIKTEQDIEEELAEDFRKYREDQVDQKTKEAIEKPKSGIHKFFESLLNFFPLFKRKFGKNKNNEENKDNLTKVQKLFEDISNGRYANKKMTIRDKDRETATDLDSEIKKKLNSMGFSDDDLSHIDKSIIDDIRFCFS